MSERLKAATAYLVKETFIRKDFYLLWLTRLKTSCVKNFSKQTRLFSGFGLLLIKGKTSSGSFSSWLAVASLPTGRPWPSHIIKMISWSQSLEVILPWLILPGPQLLIDNRCEWSGQLWIEDDCWLTAG